MSITTKTGDKGQTMLLSGALTGKTDKRIEAVGSLDELSAFLGLAKLLMNDSDRFILNLIQEDLIGISGYVISIEEGLSPQFILSAERVSFLEGEIKRLELLLPPGKGFILPGKTEAEARLHIARTVARRAERTLLNLDDIHKNVRQYLNRLSDYLFLLAETVAE